MTAFAFENMALHPAYKKVRPMDSKNPTKAEDSFYSSTHSQENPHGSPYSTSNEDSFQSFHRSVKKLQNLVVHNNTSQVSSPPNSPNIALAENMIHGLSPYSIDGSRSLGPTPSLHQGHFLVQGMPYGELPSNRQEHIQRGISIPVTPYHPHSYQGHSKDEINHSYPGFTNSPIFNHEAAPYYNILHPQLGSGHLACYAGHSPWYSSPVYSNGPMQMPVSPRMQHIPNDYAVPIAMNVPHPDQQYYSHDLPVSPGPPIQTTTMNKGPDGANLFIFHIPNNFTNLDMYALFSSCGKLLSVRIMVEKDTGRSRGFGFVSYQTPEAAGIAILKLNGYQVRP